MRKYGIYDAMSEDGECIRVAVLSTVEQSEDFAVADFFPETDEPPERMGEITITGDYRMVSDHFRTRMS